jgi:hypothetical protein
LLENGGDDNVWQIKNYIFYHDCANTW